MVGQQSLNDQSNYRKVKVIANIFEIVRRLRTGEVIEIDTKYVPTVMQQIDEHSEELGEVPPIQFKLAGRKSTMKIKHGI